LFKLFLLAIVQAAKLVPQTTMTN